MCVHPEMMFRVAATEGCVHRVEAESWGREWR